MAADPMTLPWRLGKKPFRTIYAVTGGKTTKTDILVGTMSTPAIASQLVAQQNAALQPAADSHGGFSAGGTTGGF